MRRRKDEIWNGRLHSQALLQLRKISTTKYCKPLCVFFPGFQCLASVSLADVKCLAWRRMMRCMSCNHEQQICPCRHKHWFLRLLHLHPGQLCDRSEFPRPAGFRGIFFLGAPTWSRSRSTASQTCHQEGGVSTPQNLALASPTEPNKTLHFLDLKRWWSSDTQSPMHLWGDRSDTRKEEGQRKKRGKVMACLNFAVFQDCYGLFAFSPLRTIKNIWDCKKTPGSFRLWPKRPLLLNTCPNHGKTIRKKKTMITSTEYDKLIHNIIILHI